MVDTTKLESLGDIVGEADAIATGAPTPEQQAQAAAAQAEQLAEDSAREWGVIAYTIGTALAVLAPELRNVYTEEACFAWGRSMVPVAQKYGFDGPGNVPELGLLISTMSLGVPTALVLRAKIAALRSAPGADPDRTAGATDVTFRETAPPASDAGQ
jgi:hypothetical protein